VIDRAVGWIDTRLAVGLALPDVLVLVVLVLHVSSLLVFDLTCHISTGRSVPADTREGVSAVISGGRRPG